MALRKVQITRDAVCHIAGDCCQAHGELRLLAHLAKNARESGMKGVLVLNIEQGGLTMIGDAAKGFDLRTARVYAENWSKIFAPK